MNTAHDNLTSDRLVQELEERLRFEQLISDLSARFISLPAHQVDSEIEAAQQRICESLGIDRSGLWQFSEENKELVLVTHSYAAPGVQPAPHRQEARENFPWILQRVFRNEIVSIPRIDELPNEAAWDKENLRRVGLKSTIAIPFSAGGVVFGGLSFGALKQEREWPALLVQRLRLVAEIFANALERKRTEEELKKSYREIKELKDRLQAESDYLRAEVKLAYRHGAIIGESAAIKKVLSQVEQVAATDSIVLIQGETGTGKELIAEAIHNHSLRKERVMVKVNCATLPPPLVESELFGRERGAYTGALTKQAGRFEIANGSTIFLDEIGEMALELQAKFLRVLQNGEFERLGSPKTIKVDVRVIAATNRDLEEEMRKGNFREDLYYRLNVFPILMPPLRERVEDIPPLVWAFVNEFGKKMGKKIQKIPKTTMETLQRHSWPGNIRELRNVIENAMILSAGSTLLVQAFDHSDSIKPAALTLEETERRHIFAVLEKTNWRVKGVNGAAELLGLKPGTLYAKMHKLGIPHGRQKGLNIDQKSK